MSVAWSIKDWNEVFEDHRSRQVDRLHFIPCRVLDRKSDAYATLVAMPGGVEAYGVFWALVLLAARCPERGVLADDRGPMTPLRMSVKSRLPVEAIERAIGVLSSPDVGWLVRAVRDEVAGCDNARDKSDVGATTGRRPRDVGDAKSDAQTAKSDAGATPKGGVRAQRARDNNSNNTTTATTTAAPPSASPAAADGMFTDEELEARAASLRRRPEWLPESKGWLDAERAMELAMLLIDGKAVAQALSEVRASRLTLDNPAGAFVAKLRKAGGAK